MSLTVQEVIVSNKDRVSGDDCDFIVQLSNNATLDETYSHVAVSQVAVKGNTVNVNENNNRLYFAVNTQALVTNYGDVENTYPIDYNGSARSFSKTDYISGEKRTLTAKPENNFLTYIEIPVGNYTPETLVTAINDSTFPADELYTNFSANAPTYRTFFGDELPFWGYYKARNFLSDRGTTVNAHIKESGEVLTFDGVNDIQIEKPNFRPSASYDSITKKFTLSIVYDGSITPGSTTQGTSVDKNQFIISSWKTPYWGETDPTYSYDDTAIENGASEKYFLYPGTIRLREKLFTFFEFNNEGTLNNSDQIEAIRRGYFYNVSVLATVVPYYDSNEFFFNATKNLNSAIGFTGSNTFFKDVTYNNATSTLNRRLSKTKIDVNGITSTVLTANQTFYSTFSTVVGKNLDYDDSQFYDSFTAPHQAVSLFKTGLTWLLCSNLVRRPLISTHPNVVEAMCMIPCNQEGEYTLTEFVYDHDFEIEPGILRNLRFKISDLEGVKLDFSGEVTILLRFKKLDMITNDVKRQRLN